MHRSNANSAFTSQYSVARNCGDASFSHRTLRLHCCDVNPPILPLLLLLLRSSRNQEAFFAIGSARSLCKYFDKLETL